MNTQVSNDACRTSIICIDSYDSKVMAGRLYNAYYNGGVTFNSTMELLKTINNMLEDMNCPQSFSASRIFWSSNTTISVVPTTDPLKEGKIATFVLRILFRQNSSWQGAVTWQEGKKEECFRSVLELLLLLDSALSSEDESQI